MPNEPADRPTPVLPWHPNPRPRRPLSPGQIQRATVTLDRDAPGLTIRLNTPGEVVTMPTRTEEPPE